MMSVRLAAGAAIVGCAALWALPASAQVFRIVGPDGKVTFSDRPPPDGKATAANSVQMPATAGSSTSTLPLELRSTVTRFPFTLYTTPDCSPCGSARAFLSQRGVPYTERTVSTPADIDALQKIAGQPRVPFATLGGQHLSGFSEAEWTQYLDAAGYPKTSQLPASYRNPAPSPLVPVQVREAGPAEAAPAPERAELPTRRSPESPSNPAGIRF
ncbi:glutaredoxin domain-containing protein [Ramlibacter sp.]|uniref:glutaredoxin domain-containing protein n=1 Tax=Ramlibacter sp. TaxID=1917967 RepID=UPI003FA68939